MVSWEFAAKCVYPVHESGSSTSWRKIAFPKILAQISVAVNSSVLEMKKGRIDRKARIEDKT